MQSNHEDQYEPQDPIQEAKDIAKRDWQRKSYQCSRSGSHHDLIPVSWEMTPKSKSVTMLMCKRCFHQINMTEAWQHAN